MQLKNCLCSVAVKPLAVRRQLPATPTAPCKASPELPKKPVIKPKSEEASAEDAKGDTLKKESDDTATKPATTVPQAEDKDTLKHPFSISSLLL